jgi:hypothetical protein
MSQDLVRRRLHRHDAVKRAVEHRAQQLGHGRVEDDERARLSFTSITQDRARLPGPTMLQPARMGASLTDDQRHRGGISAAVGAGAPS